MAKKQNEYLLQKAVCNYLNRVHPDILFMTDTIASIKITLQQGVRNKAVQKPNFKCPDLIIFEPNGKYNGLFLELKTESPFKKTSKGQNREDLYQDEHLLGQYDTMAKLSKKGYYCSFVWSYEMAVEIIENYLKNKF